MRLPGVLAPWRRVEDRRRRRGVLGAIATGVAAIVLAVTGWWVLPPSRDPAATRAATVFADAQALFQRAYGEFWYDAVLVLFSGSTRGTCGRVESAGPHYCADDGRVYLDLEFLRGLEAAAGPFAGAYVVAHEVGHHVQAVSGLPVDVDDVARELSADCLAGVWIASAQARGLLEPGDLVAAARAAELAGDDVQSPGSRPETWRHGSAAQRAGALEMGARRGVTPCLHWQGVAVAPRSGL